jgi:hypothetical protein
MSHPKNSSLKSYWYSFVTPNNWQIFLQVNKKALIYNFNDKVITDNIIAKGNQTSAAIGKCLASNTWYEGKSKMI